MTQNYNMESSASRSLFQPACAGDASFGGTMILEALAQLALLELASRCARNRLDELEGVRQPELREARREKLLQFCGRRGRARLQHDGRQRAFAAPGAGDRDDRRLGDRRMTHQ